MEPLRRFFPEWVSPRTNNVTDGGEFAPEKIMQRMKRDAAIILGKPSGLFDFSAILLTVVMASTISLPLLYLFA